MEILDFYVRILGIIRTLPPDRGLASPADVEDEEEQELEAEQVTFSSHDRPPFIVF